MSFDVHSLEAYSTVLTAPSPATSGTTLVLQSGDGAKFGYPQNATVWPAGTSIPTKANSEIVRITGISTDTLTITRAQEGSLAISITAGMQIANTITPKVLTDIESYTNPTGMINPYAGRSAPTGWLLCYGQAVSQATYANLFAAIVPNLGAVTITNASPAVVTLSGHGFVTGDQLYFNGSGTINTGLAQNTNYFVIAINSTTFNLATTLANAEAGTKINTTGALSGTINCYAQPYGGASATNFNIPDLRGNVLAGADAMGGTAASRLTLSTAQGTYGMLGATGGEQSHTIVTAELASHNHAVTDPTHAHTQALGGSLSNVANVAGSYVVGNANSSTTGTSSTGISINNTGSGSAHNNVQPTVIVNYIIKT